MVNECEATIDIQLYEFEPFRLKEIPETNKKFLK